MADKDQQENIEKLALIVKKLSDELSQFSERVEKIENGLSTIAEKAQDAKTTDQWKKDRADYEAALSVSRAVTRI